MGSFAVLCAYLVSGSKNVNHQNCVEGMHVCFHRLFGKLQTHKFCVWQSCFNHHRSQPFRGYTVKNVGCTVFAEHLFPLDLADLLWPCEVGDETVFIKKFCFRNYEVDINVGLKKVQYPIIFWPRQWPIALFETPSFPWHQVFPLTRVILLARQFSQMIRFMTFGGETCHRSFLS